MKRPKWRGATRTVSGGEPIRIIAKGGKKARGILEICVGGDGRDFVVATDESLSPDSNK
jgi:hypothetical protein